MKYVQQVFERLSRGKFISSDSVSEETRNIFIDMENCREEYADYFAKIGYILEEGNGLLLPTSSNVSVIGSTS